MGEKEPYDDHSITHGICARCLEKELKEVQMPTKSNGSPLAAWEVFESMYKAHCPECYYATGDDWEFKDFSNKTVVICPRCETEYNVEQGGKQ